MADYSQLLYGSLPSAIPQGVRPIGKGLPQELKDKAIMREEEYARRQLDAINNVISSGQTQLDMMNKFMEKNRQSRTGGIHEGFMSSFMPDSWRGDDEQVMTSIQSKLAPNLRVEGSGTTSDKDIALYLNSLPSISKGGEANREIVNTYKEQLDNATKKADFLNNWYQQEGNLNGAQNAWQKLRIKTNVPKKSGITITKINDGD